MRFWNHTRVVMAGVVLALGLSACGGGDDADVSVDEDVVAAEEVADGQESADDVLAEIEAEAAELREEVDAPDIDVCGLLDTDALVAVMAQAGGEDLEFRSTDGLFGPKCAFSGRPVSDMMAYVDAMSLPVEEILVMSEAEDAPDVGDGVLFHSNPNNSSQRTYTFTARDLTFQVTTMFADEAGSKEFATQAVAMVRG